MKEGSIKAFYYLVAFIFISVVALRLFQGLSFTELVLGMIMVKHLIRILFFYVPLQCVATESIDRNTLSGAREKLLFLPEHICFSVWGCYIMVIMRGYDNVWLFSPSLMWEQPQLVSELFHYYYLFKCATHSEDLLTLLYTPPIHPLYTPYTPFIHHVYALTPSILPLYTSIPPYTPQYPPIHLKVSSIEKQSYLVSEGDDFHCELVSYYVNLTVVAV